MTLVKREVVVKEADENGLVVDFSAPGVWEPQVESLFDVRVVTTDVYLPMVTAPMNPTDGVFAKKANFFLKRLATGLATKWEKPYNYSDVAGWVHRRLQLAITRATNICLKGSRMKWRSLAVEDATHLRN